MLKRQYNATRLLSLNRLVNVVVKQNAYMFTDSGIITVCLNLNSIYSIWHLIGEFNFENNLL